MDWVAIYNEVVRTGFEYGPAALAIGGFGAGLNWLCHKLKKGKGSV